MYYVDRHKISNYREMIDEEIARLCFTHSISRPEAYFAFAKELGLFLQIETSFDSICAFVVSSESLQKVQDVKKRVRDGFKFDNSDVATADLIWDRLNKEMMETSSVSTSADDACIAAILKSIDPKADIHLSLYEVEAMNTSEWQRMMNGGCSRNQFEHNPDQQHLFESDQEFSIRRDRQLKSKLAINLWQEFQGISTKSYGPFAIPF